MSMEVGRIDLGLDVNQKYFNRQLSGLAGGAEKQAKSAFSGLGAKIGTVIGVAAVASFTKSCLGLGSALTEVQNVVDTTFTSMNQDVNNFAKNAMEQFGLSETVAKRYTGVLGTMSRSMGTTEQTAYEMATSVAGLAADVASFYDMSSDTAFTKLKSIWTGETETLKDLGVIMTQTALDQYALNEGLGKTTAKMSEQEKLMLRYRYVMSRLSGAQGDFFKTQDSWANQVRVLTLRFESLKATLGQGFINLFTPIIQSLNILLGKLQGVAEGFRSVTEAMFGKQTVNAAGAVSESALEAAENITGVGDAVKEAKKALAGFDELNVVSSGQKTSASIPGTPTDTPGTTPGANDAIETNGGLAKSLQKLKDAISPTLDALGDLKDALKPVADFVFSNIKSFYEDILKPIGTWVLSEGLPKLLDVFSGLLNSIDWGKLADAFKKVNEAIAPFAIKVGEGFLYFIDSLVGLLKPVVSKTVSLLADALSAMADVINIIPEDVTIAIGGAIGGLATAILLFNGATAISGVIKKIKDAFVGKSGLITLIAKHPILTIAAGVMTLAGAVLALQKAKFERSEIGQYITKIEELVESSKDLNEEIQIMLDSHDERRKDIEVEYGAVQILADKYFALADQESLTNDEQLLMKTYAGELIEKIPELSGLIDDQTGAYKGTKEEIMGLIGKTKEYYLVQAARESLIEIAQAQYESEKKLKELTDKRTEAENILAGVEEKKKARYDELIQKAKDRNGGMLNQVDSGKALMTVEREYSETIRGLKGAIDLVNDQIDETIDTQNELNAEWDYATDYITTYSETAKEDIEAVEKAVKDLDKQFGKTDLAGKAKGVLSGFVKTFNNDTTALNSVKTWLQGINDTIKNWQMPQVKVPTMYEAVMQEAYNAGGIGGQNKTAKLPGYASGVYVGANTPHLAVIGDNKREGEIVSPESKFQEMLNKASSGSNEEQIRLLKQQNALLQAILEKTGITTKDIFGAVKSESDEYRKSTGKLAFS